MSDSTIALQEELAHQALEISRLSEELYAQQKEIAVLKEQVGDFKEALESGALIRSPEEETPPPHY